MSNELLNEAQRALTVEIKLQDCYRKMSQRADNPKVKAVLHDLLLMEEMNEVLLRSLHQRLVV
ncbi:MAG: hypothetical protein PHW95_03875 [Patescibacteria group bacterium]|nr:hypothetical protein [Patescibacteria group bacterium]